MKHLDQRIRVPIEEDNPSICRVESRCIKCGNCAKVCENFCSVSSNYNLSRTKKAICVECGQCLMSCPVNSIESRSYLDEVKAKINEGKVVIVSTSPACRVSLGEEFGLPSGKLVEDEMVGLLRRLGFSYVLDTNFGADVTIVEEANELINRIKNNAGIMFSSCCPAWVKFAETFYPNLIENLSSCRSPIGMQGALIKTYFAQKTKINPEDIVNVCLTPCVSKIMEINRPEQNKSSLVSGLELRDMDYCLTVRDVAEWAKENELAFNKIKKSKFDKLMSTSSGVGAMFGKTGGVGESVVKYLYSIGGVKRGYKPNWDITDNPAIKTMSVPLKEKTVRIACIYGLKNVREFLDDNKNLEKFDFVEVMACPGGCIGGGGQPKTRNFEPKINEDRALGLNKKFRRSKIVSPKDNPEIKALYKNYLSHPASSICEMLLHTTFTDRSKDLKLRARGAKTTYKCGICGKVFQSRKGIEPKCPNCEQEKTNIIKLD